MLVPALETSDLSKTYGTLTALDAADLAVAAGEVVGFVGPNGAGKSTLMKLVAGLAKPTRGSARVFGIDAVREGVAARRALGYLPGDLGLYRGMTGARLLDFTVSFGGSGDASHGRALAARLAVPLDRRIKAYSSGMRQKLGLLLALAQRSRLLLLDEPTRGLDPSSQALFLELIAEERARGTAVLLSSHVLVEIERVCDRIVFIDGGRLVDERAVAAARAEFRDVLRVALAADRAANLAALPGVKAVARGRDCYELTLAGPVEPVLRALADLGVEALEYNRPSLDEVYRRLYLRHGVGPGAPR